MPVAAVREPSLAVQFMAVEFMAVQLMAVQLIDTVVVGK